MKKRILLLAITLLIIISYSNGQIALEHRYDSASTGSSPNDLLMIINFPVSGEEYVKINMTGKVIELYNLNHSFIKSISYAGFPQDYYNWPTIMYLSQNLFTTDSKIDFMYIYSDSVSLVGGGWGTIANTLIYNEDGTLIFEADSLTPLVSPTFPNQQWPIYNTSQGTKMILSHYLVNGIGQGYVYSLPGTLTTSINEENNNLIAMQKGRVSNAYPNPNNGSTQIDYTLPPGVNEGEIVFYNLQGTEVKRFKVDRTFTTLLVSTKELAAGSYYYQLQTEGDSSGGKKMVVIK